MEEGGERREWKREHEEERIPFTNVYLDLRKKICGEWGDVLVRNFILHRKE